MCVGLNVNNAVLNYSIEGTGSYFRYENSRLVDSYKSTYLYK